VIGFECVDWLELAQNRDQCAGFWEEADEHLSILYESRCCLSWCPFFCVIFAFCGNLFIFCSHKSFSVSISVRTLSFFFLVFFVTFLTFLGTVAYSLLITSNQKIVGCVNTNLVVKHSPTAVTRNPNVRCLFPTPCTMSASVMKHENNVSRVVGYEPIISGVFMSLT
jgi:predicted membrane protein